MQRDDWSRHFSNNYRGLRFQLSMSIPGRVVGHGLRTKSVIDTRLESCDICKQPMKRLAPVVMAIASLALVPSWGRAREGFYFPSQVTTPFDQTAILRSLARVSENSYWDAIVSSNPSAEIYPNAARKTYLPQGVILWHIALSKKSLLQMMDDPSLRYDVGIGDIVRAFKSVDAFPAEKIIPIRNWTNATFISKSGLLLTNYHVVREQIELLGRERGCSKEAPAPYVRVQLPKVDRGRVVAWTPVGNVHLVANLSAADWQNGLSGALLRVDDADHGFLRVRQSPPSVGEDLWLYGYPFASNRPPARTRRYGYSNADGTLRVSIGKMVGMAVGVESTDFVLDADGTRGDNGGAVVDRQGELLGYDWNIFGQESAGRITSFAGGDIVVPADEALTRMRHLGSC